MRRSHFLSLLGIAAPLTTMAFGPVFADTRIFSVQTDNSGVTVTTIVRDGQPLSQVGESGARTFFEIDAGSETVPCSNQLAFTTSNGQSLEYVVDLCAHNWQVTLPLGAAAPNPSPPSSSAPAATAPASLTIYTDDPKVGIDEVQIDKQPATIGSRQANAVAVNLTAGQRDDCEHDLGLVLDDGRRIARMVDICTPNGSIVVALNDEGSAVGAAPPPISGPPAPPAVPPVASPPPSPPPASGTAEIEVVENLTWSSVAEGTRATLSYALPNSDQVEFFASCNRGAKQTEINLARTGAEVQPGASVPVTFTAGTYAHTFMATGSDVNALTGASQAELTAATDDPLWAALIGEEFLVVQIGSALPYALSLKGSSAAGRPFIAACNESVVAGMPGPPGVPGGPPPAGGATAGDYPCSEENTLSSQRSNIESKLIVRNASPQSIQLFWIDYNGSRRPFLSLGPGETGVQPTYFTHPWIVADASGRCLSIYYARRTDRQIVVGP